MRPRASSRYPRWKRGHTLQGWPGPRGEGRCGSGQRPLALGTCCARMKKSMSSQEERHMHDIFLRRLCYYHYWVRWVQDVASAASAVAPSKRQQKKENDQWGQVGPANCIRRPPARPHLPIPFILTITPKPLLGLPSSRASASANNLGIAI